MGGSGIGASDEESSIRRVRLNRIDFRAAKLNDDVLVRFNYTKTDYPSTEDFISEFYKYALITKTDITAHDFDCDLLNINRIVAENWELDALKNVIISNLNQPKLIVFGTHPAAFVPYEDKYNKIKALFDFVKAMADGGAIINVGLHEALHIIESWRTNHNVVPQRYRLWKLRRNEVFANNGKTYKCTDAGVPAVYELTISGTSSSGTITFNIDGDTTKTIDVASGKNANEVANLFFSHAVYQNYRINVIGNKVYLTRSRTDDASVLFEIVENTSGCAIDVRLATSPTQSVYEELV